MGAKGLLESLDTTVLLSRPRSAPEANSMKRVLVIAALTGYQQPAGPSPGSEAVPESGFPDCRARPGSGRRCLLAAVTDGAPAANVVERRFVPGCRQRADTGCSSNQQDPDHISNVIEKEHISR